MPPTSSLPAAIGGGVPAAPTAAAEANAGAEKAKGASKTRASRSAAPLTAADLAGVLLPNGVLSGLVRAIVTGRMTTTRRPRAAGYATPASTTASKTDSLAFLRDPKLSLEQKLIKLLGYLNAKWDKELQEKLDKIAAADAAGAATKTSAAKPKSKGLFGSIASAVSGALGGPGVLLDALKIPAVKTALKKLGGPVLAAAASALGLPAAAPLLLQYGPTVVDAALGIAGAAQGKTSQATSTSGAAMSESERQSVVMEIQNIRAKQNEMFTLVSNILKSNHDTRSAIINNIR